MKLSESVSMEYEDDCECEPDRAFFKLVMERLELSGDYWRVQVEGAMRGSSGCAAHVLAHCEKQQGERI